MSANFYTVTFTSTDGNETISRFFQTLTAARKWAAFLNSTTWAKAAKIYRGQAGGELVA